MKINSIKLQNYRSHSTFDKNFSSGINLLLGKNGAGKSSILEAIGLCLFGASPRTNLGDAIKVGEKFALIIIDFVANDGNTYRVERRIGTQATIKLYVTNEQSPRFIGDDAIKYIKELVGLDHNADVIYKNVITAEQNKLTEIFQLTPIKRAEEFNKIFNTEIYRDIYQRNSKFVLERYLSELALVTREIDIHSINLKETAQLKKLLENEKLELDRLVNEEVKIRKQIEELEQQNLAIDIELKQINKLKNEISNNKTRINDLDRLIIRLHEGLISAQKSQVIVQQCSPDYLLYQEIEKNKKYLNISIKSLEKIEEKKHNIEKDIVKKEKELHTLKSKIDSNNEIIKLKLIDTEQINSSILSLDSESQVATIQINNIDNQISIIKKTRNDFANLLTIRQQKSNDIESISKLISNKKMNLADENSINQNIESTKGNLEILETLRNKKIKLETEKEQLNVRNKILNEAKEKLKGSICPYLEQKCKNIDDQIDSDIFFNSKLDDISNELKLINGRLKELINIDKQIDEAKNQISSLNNRLMNNKDLLIEIEKYSGNINLLNEELNTNLKEIEIVFQNHSIPLEYDLNQLEQSNIKLNHQFDEFNKSLAEQNTIKKNCEKNLIENKRKLNILKSEIEKINNENRANSIKISEFENQNNLGKENLKTLENELIELPKLKESYQAANSELERLNPNYILYNQNIDNSKKVDTIIESISKENNQKTELNEQTNKLIIELNQKNEQKILDESHLIVLRIKAENQKIALNASTTATVKSSIDNLKNLIKQNIEIENLIKSLKKDEKMLNKKIELTKIFRENINSMGTIVAGRLLTEIAHKASENYFKISQKSESIEWVNNQIDKYQVYLINKATNIKRKFEMLSGGEQVSVAIAIRTALAQSLTSANFAIFDEPTVNLDKDRKELLSRSLNTMLDKLEQVFVVTHDDSFQEMAEAIQIGDEI